MRHTKVENERMGTGSPASEPTERSPGTVLSDEMELKANQEKDKG